jgi:hypothetical protein
LNILFQKRNAIKLTKSLFINIKAKIAITLIFEGITKDTKKIQPGSFDFHLINVKKEEGFPKFHN